MKHNNTATFFSILLAGFLTPACQRDLTPVSNLITEPLTHSDHHPLDGTWRSPKADQISRTQAGYLYFSPLDTKLIAAKYPKEAKAMQAQMHDHIVKYVGSSLQQANALHNGNWQLTQNPQNADVTVDIAVVKMKPTQGIANAVGTIGSFFSPIPGTGTIISQFTKGSIGIEGRMMDNHSKQPIYEFKDTNKDQSFLFSFNDYGRFGHNEEALAKWAKTLGSLIVEGVKEARQKPGL